MILTNRLLAITGMACVIATPAAWSQALPPSMLDQPAQPPLVHLDGGSLTIEATNSSLRAILDDLGQRTGTRIDGLAHDERIFGVYGPGNPQQVLASVLEDSGYNILISGKKADGAPREIVLSARTSVAAAQPASAGVTQAAQENDDNDSTDVAPPPPPHPSIFTPPPQAPAANGQPDNPQQQIKTPAQMLQELQQLRQAQQQSSPQ